MRGRSHPRWRSESIRQPRSRRSPTRWICGGGAGRSTTTSRGVWWPSVASRVSADGFSRSTTRRPAKAARSGASPSGSPARGLAWQSTGDDVAIDVTFEPTAVGTLVRVEAQVPEGWTRSRRHFVGERHAWLVRRVVREARHRVARAFRPRTARARGLLREAGDRSALAGERVRVRRMRSATRGRERAVDRVPGRQLLADDLQARRLVARGCGGDPRPVGVRGRRRRAPRSRRSRRRDHRRADPRARLPRLRRR